MRKWICAQPWDNPALCTKSFLYTQLCLLGFCPLADLIAKTTALVISILCFAPEPRHIERKHSLITRFHLKFVITHIVLYLYLEILQYISQVSILFCSQYGYFAVSFSCLTPLVPCNSLWKLKSLRKSFYIFLLPTHIGSYYLLGLYDTREMLGTMLGQFLHLNLVRCCLLLKSNFQESPPFLLHYQDSPCCWIIPAIML